MPALASVASRRKRLWGLFKNPSNPKPFITHYSSFHFLCHSPQKKNNISTMEGPLGMECGDCYGLLLLLLLFGIIFTMISSGTILCMITRITIGMLWVLLEGSIPRHGCFEGKQSPPPDHKLPQMP